MKESVCLIYRYIQAFNFLYIYIYILGLLTHINQVGICDTMSEKYSVSALDRRMGLPRKLCLHIIVPFFNCRKT